MILIFAISLVLNLSIYFVTYFTWKKIQENKFSDFEQGISVIIASHNDLLVLKNVLQDLFNQKYQKFEIIIVNDRSNDGTFEYLEKIKHNNLKIITINQIKNELSPKKSALTKGIQSAKYENLAFTDADCRMSENWLKSINNAFANEAELVLGIGNYEGKSGLLNGFIQYETFTTMLYFFTTAKLKIPHMALGRNIAYKKSLWEKVNGFSSHQRVLSGDDDLFVNSLPKNTKIALIYEKKSQTSSKPPENFRNWFKQKTRHVSAGKSYSLRSKIIISTIQIGEITFFLSFVILLTFNPAKIWQLATLYIFKQIVKIFVYKSVSNKIQGRISAFYLILFEVLYILYNLLIVPYSFFIKPKWK